MIYPPISLHIRSVPIHVRDMGFYNYIVHVTLVSIVNDVSHRLCIPCLWWKVSCMFVKITKINQVG